MFDKILIANRGEIACRVIRTARRLGIATVAVHSDADAGALHVALADEAVRLGPASARESYLAIDAVIDAARAIGAQAIHPGYGFLSENPVFAERCAEAGIVFIGPPAAAIRAMGAKSEAKALMERAGVPLVPGYHGADQDPRLLAAEAARIGYPVLIKASAGGGGKGMRVVTGPDQFADQLAGAQREAMASFGDDRVLVERYLARPRHVEVQVFADRHGGCVHLFDRDCSIQRRHQKVVEEAPAPGLDPDLRRRMGEAAVAAARAIGYVGAGTIEFLVDPSAGDGAFYFMEMNTRLQVEHPVTEYVTGQDLVEWQLRVAAGEPLPLDQGQLAVDGHAIEVRLYAEDPARDFLPQTGRIGHLRFPEAGRHVRVETGARAGDAVTIHYDPMIAKLIVWDRDRPAAAGRLRRALAETEIAGLATNRDMLAAITRHPAFLAGELDTGFVERHRDALLAQPPAPGAQALALAVAGLLVQRGQAVGPDPWDRTDGWRLNLPTRERLRLCPAGGEAMDVTVAGRRGGWQLAVSAEGADIALAAAVLADDGTLTARLDAVTRKVRWLRRGQRIDLFADGVAYGFDLVDPLATAEGAEMPHGHLAAPMPGRVAAVLVAPGTAVKRGQALLVLEAMKMEHTIAAPADGVVEAVRCAVGEQVEEGIELVVLAEGDAAA